MAEKVTDFDGIKSLLLMEVFRAKLDKPLRTHLDDLGVKDVQVAARIRP